MKEGLNSLIAILIGGALGFSLAHGYYIVSAILAAVILIQLVLMMHPLWKG